MNDDAEAGLTEADATEREADLRLEAEDNGLRIAFSRAPEPSGLITLTWRILPPAPPATGPAGVAASLRGAAVRVGVDERLLAAIAVLESGLDPHIPSRTSSARGLFQFIDGTWNGMVAQYGPALGVTAGQRDEVPAQCLMGAKLLSVTAAALQAKLGRRASAGECYAGHFFGAGGAGILIAGDPARPVDAALRQVYAAHPEKADTVITANRAILTEAGRARSVGAVLTTLDAKIKDGLGRVEHLFDVLPGNVEAQGVPGEPPWLAVARAELARGVAEIPGAANNPRIEEYFTWTALGSQPDSIAWCAAFASYCLGMSNLIVKGRGSARAADWNSFGRELATPVRGCIAVLKPNPNRSGHVAFWIENAGNRLHLLGGNQGDRVSIEPFPMEELRSFRMPN